MRLLWMIIRAYLLTRSEITWRAHRQVVKLLAPYGEQTETPTSAGSAAASCRGRCCCRETHQQLCAVTPLHCSSLSLCSPHHHHQLTAPFSLALLVLCNSNHLIWLITCWARDLTSKPAEGHQLWRRHDTYTQGARWIGREWSKRARLCVSERVCMCHCTLRPRGAVSQVEADLRPPGAPLLEEVHQRQVQRESPLWSKQSTTSAHRNTSGQLLKVNVRNT